MRHDSLQNHHKFYRDISTFIPTHMNVEAIQIYKHDLNYLKNANFTYKNQITNNSALISGLTHTPTTQQMAAC